MPDRRSLRQLAPASAAVFLIVCTLAACGGSHAGTASGGSATSTASAAFPVTITHKFGSTTISKAPQRIVTVGYNDEDFVLALGKVPVGTRGPTDYAYATRPWAQSAVRGAPAKPIGSTEINFEKVAAARPDLIVGIYSGMTQSDYSKLSQIAPTIDQTSAYVDFGEPWEEQLKLVARAMGQVARSQNVIDSVHAQFAAARSAHPEFAGKSAVLIAANGTTGYYVYTAKDLRGRFFDSLGFKVPTAIDKLAGKLFYAQISDERVALIDTDVVIVFGERKDFEANPLFRHLRAVREGRVIYLPIGKPDLYGALNYNSPLSLPFELAGFVPRLAAAVDGDPKTAVAPIT